MSGSSPRKHVASQDPLGGSFHSIPRSVVTASSTPHSWDAPSPGGQIRELAVFWDYENVPVPSWCDPTEACNAIVQRLGHLGRIIERKLYYDFDGNVSPRTERIWSALDASGFSLVNTPRREGGNIKKETLDKKLIADVLAFSWDADIRSKGKAKPCIILLTSDGDYTYTLNLLRDRGVKTILIYQPDRVSPALPSTADTSYELDRDILKFCSNNPAYSGTPSSRNQRNVLPIPPSSLILPITPDVRRKRVVSVPQGGFENLGMPPAPILPEAEPEQVDEKRAGASFLCAILSGVDPNRGNWAEGYDCASTFRAAREDGDKTTESLSYQDCRLEATKLGWIEIGRLGSDGKVSANSERAPIEGAGRRQWLRLTKSGQAVAAREKSRSKVEVNDEKSVPASVVAPPRDASVSPTLTSSTVSSCGSPLIYVGNLGKLEDVRELVSLLKSTDPAISIECAYCEKTKGGQRRTHGYVRLSSEQQAARLIRCANKKSLSLNGSELKLETARKKGVPDKADSKFWYEESDARSEHDADWLILRKILAEAKVAFGWRSWRNLFLLFQMELGGDSSKTARLKQAIRSGISKGFLDLAQRNGNGIIRKVGPCEAVLGSRIFYVRLAQNVGNITTKDLSLKELYGVILRYLPSLTEDNWVENGRVVSALQLSTQRNDGELKSSLKNIVEELVSQGLVELSDSSVTGNFVRPTPAGISRADSISISGRAFVFEIPVAASVDELVSYLEDDIGVHVQNLCLGDSKRRSRMNAILELADPSQCLSFLKFITNQKPLFRGMRIDAIVLQSTVDWSMYESSEHFYCCDNSSLGEFGFDDSFVEDDPVEELTMPTHLCRAGNSESSKLLIAPRLGDH